MIDLEEFKRAIKGGYHITLKESQELIAEVERLKADNQGLAAHQCQHPAGDEFGNAYCARIKELETVLKLVQRWGKDSRSLIAWEVFQGVAKVLNLETEQPVKVVDCTCVPCVCYNHKDGRLGGICLGCGARTCLAHELKLKTSSQTLLEAKSRVDPE